MKKLFRRIVIILIAVAILYAVNDRYGIVSYAVKQQKSTEQDSQEKFVKEVRQVMLEGKERVTLLYIGGLDDMQWFTEGAIKSAYSIDEASTSGDYDYLKFKISNVSAKIIGLGRFITVTYHFTYNESSSQTKTVDREIKKLFRKWKIEKLSDFQKVKKIHDYIIGNASYDNSLKNYSAYDNLVKKSSTCQGYMCLTYKMLTEAGIACRILSGTGNGQSHGWDIVKLNGKWYNLDCTWDDPVTWNGEELLLYDFFLKSDKDFKGHVRDPEYRTKGFIRSYPMSPVSWKD